MATYAVGDIQGCYSKLRELLKAARFSSSDTLWCAGDLINRGGEDLETLRFLKSLGDQVISVLGNHDLHLLACAFGNRRIGRKDTFGEVLEAPDRDVLLDWLRHQPLIHHDPQLGYAIVHAGIPPIWSMKQALAYASEVEKVLQSENPRPYFEDMYGNIPAGWNESSSGTERLRTITNYFTRMRFCSPEGNLEFETKSGPHTPPSGYLPWYQYPQHRCAQNKLLFGHWAAMEGNSGKTNFIGLDTGCVWGGELTLLRLDDKQRFCVDCAL